jgi:hypothetical protein
MIPVAMAAPAIIVFIIMAVVLGYERVLDFLNIPPSKLSYAKVVIKEDRGENRGMNKPIGFRYRINFEFNDGKLIQLNVPKKTYESVSVGTSGVLVHTKKRFRGFHVDKKIPDLIKDKKKSNPGRNANALLPGLVVAHKGNDQPSWT